MEEVGCVGWSEWRRWVVGGGMSEWRRWVVGGWSEWRRWVVGGGVSGGGGLWGV